MRIPYILVMDPPEVILRKFKRAVTDSERRASIVPRISPACLEPD